MHRRQFLCFAALVTLPKAAMADQLAVLVSPDGFVNLRTGPGTQHPILQRIYDGMWVDVLEHDGNWRRIALSDGTIGWASAGFLGPVYSYPFYLDVQVAETPDGFVNLRAGPGTEHAVLQRLYPGQRLRLLQDGAPWAEVQLTDGTTGWAASRYFYVDR